MLLPPTPAAIRRAAAALRRGEPVAFPTETVYGLGANALDPEAVRRVWRAGVWTLAFGSLMTGVFEIYGSPSPLTVIYWPVGAALLIAGGAMWAAEARRKKTS